MGPRKLERSNDGQLCITANGVVLAHVKDYAEEDGRLFAAAPDLLEACKNALKMIPIGYAVHNELMRVIAKAEGK